MVLLCHQEESHDFKRTLTLFPLTLYFLTHICYQGSNTRQNIRLIVVATFDSFNWHLHVSIPCPLRQKKECPTYPCIPTHLRSFPEIGGGGKRKLPPMHRMRRLREPGKIHQRRRNCTIWQCLLFMRHSGEVSQASIRRFPCPHRRSRGTRDPTERRFHRNRPTAAREICSPQQSGLTPISRWRGYFTKKFGPLDGKIATDGKIHPHESSAAGPSGLSQPDAPCEHNDIRARVENLTKVVASG